MPDGRETPSYRVAYLSSAEALESLAGLQRQQRAAAAAAAAAVEAGVSSVSLRQAEDAQLQAQPPQQRRSSVGCTQPPAAAATVAAAAEQQEPWTQRIRASDGTLELCRVPGPPPEVPSLVLGARGLRKLGLAASIRDGRLTPLPEEWADDGHAFLLRVGPLGFLQGKEERNAGACSAPRTTPLPSLGCGVQSHGACVPFLGWLRSSSRQHRRQQAE